MFNFNKNCRSALKICDYPNSLHFINVYKYLDKSSTFSSFQKKPYLVISKIMAERIEDFFNLAENTFLQGDENKLVRNAF